MKLMIGLGNPGLKYKNTRHNVGFMAADHFAKKNKRKIPRDMILVKPQLFMNNSGAALAQAIDKYKVRVDDILVICDDINLDLGIIRLRSTGSAGGHKGLQSIIDELGTEEFNRLRIGIGSANSAVLKDYVLAKFKTGERKKLNMILEMAAEAMGVWLKDGIEAAMNEFN
jgi:PTH1 family peptidyl-tRNA hydrolase